MFKLVCFWVIVLWYVAPIQGSSITGYTLVPLSTGLQVNAIMSNGSMIPVQILSQFTIQSEYAAKWNILHDADIALSPNQSHLAMIATQNNITSELFIYHVQQNSLSQYALSKPIEAQMIPRWSPDSSTILLYAYYDSGLSEPVLFDLQTGQFSAFFAGNYREDDFTWLPDGQKFLYLGDPVCTACRIRHDLYVGDRRTQTRQALTNIHALNIADKFASGAYGAHYLTWSPDEQRVYFIVYVSYDEPDYGALLYSVDLQGNTRFEYDLETIYPNTEFPIDVADLLYNPYDDKIYVVGMPDVNTNSWSILRYTPENLIETVYETTTIQSQPNDYGLSALSLSPNGQYLALGGSYTTTTEARGAVQVINLRNGQLVSESAGIEPVCYMGWSTDMSIIYSQALTDYGCQFALRDNQPAARIIQRNILTGSEKIVATTTGSPMYFVPPMTTITDFMP
jgi:WD40 repeat protein